MSTTPLNEVVALEMLTAVERHVLQEMGQATLALFFLDGTHFLCDVEVGTMLRPVVVADKIGKAIAELAYSKSCVYWDCE